ncbi:hypothetical protein HJC23_005584 [Cyclotella cryptica]|uniref:subtilisin n=1 Tax=Cyclotella cryptica TaxID=29204 RepID=A0ABD3PQK8_9STRA|eukprot:CCRYP_012499-RA/>CCRYP_012499-RA protein AED:0.03 eAED:0.01 QI:0/0/0/1/1/1/2/0/398
MIITSSLMSKLVSLLSILIAASNAAVIHDASEQHRYRDDDTTTKKTYIVTFEDDAVSPAERCTALATSNGGFVGHVYDQVFKGCSLTFPTSQAQDQAAFTALSIDSSVMDVKEDQMVYAYKTAFDDKALASRLKTADSSSQPLRTTAADTVSSWGLDRINQCALPLDGIATKQDATGVRVFILDTGVRGDHEEFAGDVISVEDCHFSAIPGENALTDGRGHGTHVAGITCGAQYGVSANCQLCSVKVLNASGKGTTAGVIAGIDYVLSKCSVPGSDLCVANMSLGGGYSSLVNKAVATAVNAGVVMVVAAGNKSSDACYLSPASEQLAITVGSTTISDALSLFSNQGPCVDIYAPGSDIVSSYATSPSAVKTFSGTSMASPRTYSSMFHGNSVSFDID